MTMPHGKSSAQTPDLTKLQVRSLLDGSRGPNLVDGVGVWERGAGALPQRWLGGSWHLNSYPTWRQDWSPISPQRALRPRAESGGALLPWGVFPGPHTDPEA